MSGTRRRPTQERRRCAPMGLGGARRVARRSFQRFSQLAARVAVPLSGRTVLLGDCIYRTIRRTTDDVASVGGSSVDFTLRSRSSNHAWTRDCIASLV
ncbi:hypothetical protein HPB50_010695 [Hyalomma asiaticum]|uniref:Uncharacterized protein n=1 Tax=Hyalomma asiaticum TaxID=266040 RepID=A0ACB7SGL8_HYAAI|nr:hypothetical protein HPB50_010695 [Hyalomma asiaticum]